MFYGRTTIDGITQIIYTKEDGVSANCVLAQKDKRGEYICKKLTVPDVDIPTWRILDSVKNVDVI